MKSVNILVVLTIIIGLSTVVCHAGPVLETNILFLIDGSHNMLGTWGNTSYIKNLRREMRKTFKEISTSQDWGLNAGIRVFGDKSPLVKKDCVDTRLATKVEWFDPITLSGVLDGIKPKGKADIDNAIKSTVSDYPGRTNQYNFLILITCSKDECGANPLTSARYIAKEFVTVDAIHVVGLNLSKSEVAELKPVAEVSKGQFVNVKSPAKLSVALTEIINKYSRPTLKLPEKENQKKNTTQNSK